MVKFFKKIQSIGSAAVGFLPTSALAATLPDALKPSTSGDLEDTVVDIIDVILLIAGVLAVVYLIYGGIIYITSAGNAEKATAGKNAIIYAIIGVVVILLAYLIVQFVQNKIA